MKIDTHIHSVFSCDGRNSTEEMVVSAIEKGLSVICFSEHFDMNPLDSGNKFFEEESYISEIKKMQDKYSDKIKILMGIEFSEPHQYKNELEHFNSLDFDFILGSVHWSGPGWVGDKKYQDENTIEKIYEDHYLETLNACKCGLFDSLAHIDFPKRYLPKEIEPDSSILREIIRTLVAKDISLELNTSPLRKGYMEIYPSKYIVSEYLAGGGKYFTIGSDAHNADDIGADIKKIDVKSKMQLCYYEKRKRICF